jgi:hypothetical protein
MKKIKKSDHEGRSKDKDLHTPNNISEVSVNLTIFDFRVQTILSSFASK